MCATHYQKARQDGFETVPRHVYTHGVWPSAVQRCQVDVCISALYQACSWTISAASAITLSFDSFSTERGYDYVTVYDGSSSSASQIGSFSGSELPSAVTAASGSMFVEFSADSSVEASGFVATFSTGTAANAAAMLLATQSAEWAAQASDSSSDNALLGIAVGGMAMGCVGIGWALVTSNLCRTQRGAEPTRCGVVHRSAVVEQADAADPSIAVSNRAEEAVPRLFGPVERPQQPVVAWQDHAEPIVAWKDPAELAAALDAPAIAVCDESTHGIVTMLGPDD